MYISVLSHSIDRDFSERLTLALIQHGVDTRLVTNANSALAQHQSDNLSGLIAILRPEFISSVNHMVLLRSSDTSNLPIYLVIRAPIDISIWPMDITFVNTIDFTDHDERYFSANLSDLANVLKLNTPTLRFRTPSLLESHVSNTLLNARSFDGLEAAHYSEDSASSPFQKLLETMLFDIYDKKVGSDAKKDTLKNIIHYNPRIIIESQKANCQSLVSCAAIHALNKYAHDPTNNPVPVILDVSTSAIDEAWLKQATAFSKSPYKDLDRGRILLIVHGFENAKGNTRVFFELLDKLIDITSPSLQLILVAYLSPQIPFQSLDFISIQPTETHFNDIKDLTNKYLDRPFAKFVHSIVRLDGLPHFRYFTTYPFLFAKLLSTQFDQDLDFSKLMISDYYHILVNNLWEIGCRINNDHENQLESITPSLAKCATLLTNQDRTEFDYEHITKLIGSKFAVQTCIDGGLFKQVGSNVSFSDIILQNYFTALALQQFGLPSKLPMLSLNIQNDRIQHRWDPSLVLLAHLTPDNEDLFTTLIELDPLLALDAVNSGCSISTHTYTQIIEKNLLFLRQLGDFRIAFAKRLQVIDNQTAKEVLLETMRESSWDLRMAALNVLYTLQIPLLHGVFSVINNTFDENDTAITYAIRRIGGDSIITLIQLLRHDNISIRRRSAWVLGRLNDKAATPALVTRLRDSSQEVALEAVTSLCILNDLQTLSSLAQTVNRSSLKVANAIRNTFIQMLTSARESFIQNTQELNAGSRYNIVLLICETIEKAHLEFALTFSHDPHPDIRIAALQGFLNSSDSRAIKRLNECLSDTEKSNVRKYTVSEIASKILRSSGFTDLKQKSSLSKGIDPSTDKRKSSEIVKSRLIHATTIPNGYTPTVADPDETEENELALSHHNTLNKLHPEDDLRIADILKQMREEGWDSSNDAAKQLRDYAKQLHGKATIQVMNQVIETLNDNDWVIRWAGVETLGWIGNIHVIPHLIQRLTDTNWKIRVAAIRALAEIKDESAIGAISDIANDAHSVVREAAAEALGSLGSEKTIPALEKASTDPEEFVRLAAVESLGKIKHKLSVIPLLTSLKDKSDHVRWAAANALVDVAYPQITSVLIPSLDDNGGPYWEQKRICDVVADILDQFNTDEAKSALALWHKKQAQSSN